MKASGKPWESLPLWPHQVKAIKKVRSYLSAGASGSALVMMPTGTGKSGVIAALVRCFDDVQDSLVVVPWKALRDQLTRDIKTRFWEHIKVDPSPWPRVVTSFVPSTAKVELSRKQKQGTVFVSTIQALQTIHSVRAYEKVYEKLQRRIAQVIVDEGHREPAPEWAKAVRELNKPTILFTATPYRNDFKVFTVNKRYVYAYRHQDAIKHGYIRSVDFEPVDFGKSTAEFVRLLRDFYHGPFQHRKPTALDRPPRVIVRCETNEEVNDIATKLVEAGEKVIAVHERFSDREKAFTRKTVPQEPDKREETFWVHQFKLIEGIDDPSFALLAVFRPLKNARALVQQVGRIIRNPEGKPKQVACVFFRPADRQSDFWDRYMEFSKSFSYRGERFEDERILFNNIVKLHPEYKYVQGNYRERFDIESEKSLYADFRYILATNIYAVSGNISTEELKAEVEKEWSAKDIDVRYTDYPGPGQNTWVLRYVTYQNSPILLNHLLMEYHVGYTFAHRIRQYLFFYDSQGNSSDFLSKKGRRIEPGKLEGLFHGNEARLAEVALLNTDLGRQSIRRRTIYARSIADTAPSLVDHGYFCSTALGYTKDPVGDGLVRRYVGLSRGRITDSSSITVEYSAYIEWLGALADALDESNIESLPVFERFARFVKPPAEAPPRNILLDLGDVVGSFESVKLGAGGKPAKLEIDDVCFDVRVGPKNKSTFVWQIGSEEYEVSISYRRSPPEYTLASPSLERAFVRREGGETRESLIAYLNQNQAFRVIPQSYDMIYAHGHFYGPRLPLWGRVSTGRFDLAKIFVPIREFATLASEKGNSVLRCDPQGRGWHEQTIFGKVCRLGRGIQELEAELRGIDILVCDDLGAEIADFIAADTQKQRIILIHAKAFPKPVKVSASKLQDICAQATKNLDPLQPFSITQPNKLDSWKDPWQKEGIGHVSRRILLPLSDAEPKAIWSQLREIVRNPSASREVWLLLGQLFSLSQFEEYRARIHPPAQIVQMLYWLQSTWGSVSAVGAKLRIFCSP